jgi:hypothetical protein
MILFKTIKKNSKNVISFEKNSSLYSHIIKKGCYGRTNQLSTNRQSHANTC